MTKDSNPLSMSVEALPIGLGSFSKPRARKEFWKLAAGLLVLQLSIVFSIFGIWHFAGETIASHLIALIAILFFQVLFWTFGYQRTRDAKVTASVNIVSGCISLAMLGFVGFLLVEALVLGKSVHSEKIFGAQLISFMMYPAVFAFLFALNTPFWLMPTDPNPNEVPS